MPAIVSSNSFQFLRRNFFVIALGAVLTAVLALSFLFRALSSNQSSRYYGLFYFLGVPAITTAVFICPAISIHIKRGLLTIACLYFAGKTLHYDPYDSHMQNACSTINHFAAKVESLAVINYAGEKRFLWLDFYTGDQLRIIKTWHPLQEGVFNSILPAFTHSSANRESNLVLATRVSRGERKILLNHLSDYPNLKCIYSSSVNRTKENYVMLFLVEKNVNSISIDNAKYGQNLLSSSFCFAPKQKESVIHINDRIRFDIASAQKHLCKPAYWDFNTLSPMDSFITLQQDENDQDMELWIHSHKNDVAMLHKWIETGEYFIKIDGSAKKDSVMNILIIPWRSRSSAFPFKTVSSKYFENNTEFSEYLLLSPSTVDPAPEFTLGFQVDGDIAISAVSICPKVKKDDPVSD